MMHNTRARPPAVSDQDTGWSVQHATRGRLRIRAAGLQSDAARCQRLRHFLLACEGINRVDLSPTIGSVTINYSGLKLSRARLEELLQRGLDSSREGPEPVAPEDKPLAQDAHLGALLLTLAITPLLPLPLRYLATSVAISPTLWNSLSRLREGGGASRSLDASALLLSTLAGRYGVAQVNNLMHTLGHKLEQRAVSRTESQLRLHGEPPAAEFAVKRGGAAEQYTAQELRGGDRLRLAEGDIVPVESMVLEGEARVTTGFSIDESPVAPGHRVAAGSCLVQGELELVLLQDWSQGSYARLEGFIEIAIRNRENHEHYAAHLADRLVPFTMILSGAVYGVTRDLARASSALQADFSAAHELVTPVSVETTIASGAAAGILFRGGEAIERLASVDTLVFDRSGTLTRGEWRLSEIIALGEHDEQTCRELISRLVIHCCRSAAVAAIEDSYPTVTTLSHAEIHLIQQHGLHLRLDDMLLGLTDPSMAAQRFGIAASGDVAAARLGVLFYLVVDSECVGIARFSDTLSPGNIDAIEALRLQGVEKMYLLSHESAASLNPELTSLPLDGFHTGLDELQKLHFIQDLLDDGRSVGLVSDGLFRAGADCVNICLGTEADARPLDSDLWLMRAGIDSLAAAHGLARQSTRRLQRSHRTSQASKGSMLLASSFDLLPPSLAAAVGNAVTLGTMRYAGKIDEEQKP